MLNNSCVPAMIVDDIIVMEFQLFTNLTVVLIIVFSCWLGESFFVFTCCCVGECCMTVSTVCRDLNVSLEVVSLRFFFL